MKSFLTTIVLSVFALTSFAAEPAKKEEKKADAKPAATAKATKKAEKCVPSKDVVCDKNLQGKTRPTAKKKVEDTK